MSSTPPAQSPSCRACGADVPPGAERCPRCGTTQRADVCPHCGGTAGVTRDSELRFRCDICGGPRVPPSPRGARSGQELPAVKRAQAALAGRSRWRAATVAGGLLLGFDVLLLSLFLLITGMSFGLFLTGLLTAGPLAAFVLWALSRARARGREIGPALDAAWVAAATEIAVRTEGTLTVKDLADALSIEDAQAEEMLALLEVNDVVRGAVTKGGDVAYAPRIRVGGAAAPRTVGAVGAVGAVDEKALAAAAASEEEEEALAAEEAAAEAERPVAHVDAAKK